MIRISKNLKKKNETKTNDGIVIFNWSNKICLASNSSIAVDKAFCRKVSFDNDISMLSPPSTTLHVLCLLGACRTNNITFIVCVLLCSVHLKNHVVRLDEHLRENLSNQNKPERHPDMATNSNPGTFLICAIARGDLSVVQLAACATSSIQVYVGKNRWLSFHRWNFQRDSRYSAIHYLQFGWRMDSRCAFRATHSISFGKLESNACNLHEWTLGTTTRTMWRHRKIHCHSGHFRWCIASPPWRYWVLRIWIECWRCWVDENEWRKNRSDDVERLN